MYDLVDIPAEKLIGPFGAKQSHAVRVDENNPISAMDKNCVGQGVYKGSESVVSSSGWIRLLSRVTAIGHTNFLGVISLLQR
jgi:hypothetical protein